MNSTTGSVRIEVGAEVKVVAPPPVLKSAIIASNTFENPDYARKERLGLWTGDTDRLLRLYYHTESGLVVPRGTYRLVVNLCRRHQVRYDVVDHTIAPPLGSALIPGGVLFDYQARSLGQLLAYRSGLLEAPTGSGKTNVLLSVIPKVNTTALILTHTKELLKQTAARTKQWLGIEPGIIGGGKWTIRPVTVAMIQTLARRDIGELAKYFGCVLIDECHHAPALTWAEILNQLMARYRYGFTATAFRKDGLQSVMFRTIGDVTARISSAEVTDAGKIVAPAIEKVYTNFFYAIEDSTEWGRMVAALVRDGDRNALIVAEVRRRLIPSARGLILSDRIEHVNLLAQQLSEFQPVVLTGELGKISRDIAMEEVRQGARLTIATSSLLGEGVDVPGWDTLFLVTPMAGGPRTLQAVGRVTRAAPGKARATVVDFVDRDVPALAHAHEQRERLYVRN